MKISIEKKVFLMSYMGHTASHSFFSLFRLSCLNLRESGSCTDREIGKTYITSVRVWSVCVCGGGGGGGRL